MRNLKVEIRYKGSNYHGYQYQINALSVQEVLEKAASGILQEPVRINGCSRTDTGVHANSYFFSVQTNSKIACSGFVKGMNTMLPDDIAVIDCSDESEEFHARFSSVGKHYIYKIWNGAVRNPFYENLALMYPYELDDKKLTEAAGIFEGTHDFSSFCSSASNVVDKTRTVYKIKISRQGEMVIIDFFGNGFLHNMVRIMVGTMLFYNEGKFTKTDMENLLLVPDRTKAGKTASANGLYLNKVYYSKNEMQSDIAG